MTAPCPICGELVEVFTGLGDVINVGALEPVREQLEKPPAAAAD